MKKVVSVALFGEGEKLEHYAQYVPTFVLAHLNLFPQSEGWDLRVHVDDDLTMSTKWGTLLDTLAVHGLIDLRRLRQASLTQAMLWRMAPVFDKDVDYVFCRDLDAAPLPRDRAVCETFIGSGCYVHTVHDNIHHQGVMGGLCGFQTHAFREVTGWRALEDIYTSAGVSREEWATHGTDQNVLNRFILNNPAMKLLEHRFSGWHGGPEKHPARGAGHYQCQAWSTPIPNGNGDPADLLANHMGAAGYDHKKARVFWEVRGREEVIQALRECEEAAGAKA